MTDKESTIVLAKDIMTKEVVSVHPDTNLLDVAKILYPSKLNFKFSEKTL